MRDRRGGSAPPINKNKPPDVAQGVVPGIKRKPAQIPLPNPDNRSYQVGRKTPGLSAGDMTRGGPWKHPKG